MAVLVSQSTSSANQLAGHFASSLTLTWAPTAVSDGCLVVNVGNYSSIPRTVDSITWGGTNMRKGPADEGGSFRMAQYYLVSPTAGSNNLVITWNDIVDDYVVGIILCSGVNQSAPTSSYNQNNGSSTTPSVTVTSAVNDLVIDGVYANQGTLTCGQTQIYNMYQSWDNTIGGGSSKDGAASVVMSWTSANTSWVIGGTSFRPSRNRLHVT